MRAFERDLLHHYLFTLARGKAANWNVIWRSSDLPAWLAHFAPALGLSKVIPDERKDLKDPVIRDAVRARLLERGNPQPGAVSPLEQRLAWICTRLGLSAIERRILGFLVRACSSAPFHSLAAALRSTFDPEEISAAVAADDVRLSTIAGVLGVVPSALTLRLVDGSPLRLFGLVEDRRGRDYAASSTSLRLAVAKQLDEDKARALLFGKPRRSSLTWGDFTHLDPEASVVCGLVEAAVAGQELGVNILLYGPHGGGKTEFAGALAQRAGLHALSSAKATRTAMSRAARSASRRWRWHRNCPPAGGACCLWWTRPTTCS